MLAEGSLLFLKRGTPPMVLLAGVDRENGDDQRLVG